MFLVMARATWRRAMRQQLQSWGYAVEDAVVILNASCRIVTDDLCDPAGMREGSCY